MPTSEPGQRTSDLALLRRVAHQARPYWWRIGGVLVLSLLSTPLALLTPLPLKIVVDNVLGKEPLPEYLAVALPGWLAGSSEMQLTLAIVLLVLFAGLTQVQSMAALLASATTGERLVLEFRSRLLRHAQRLSLGYHDSRGTTDSVYRIQYDAPALQYLTIDSTIPLVTSALTLIAMVVVVMRIDAQLALVALAVSPILFGISRAYQHPLRGRYSRVSDLQSRSFGVAQEAMSSLRVIQAFGTEEREEQRFLRQSGAGVRARIHLAWFEGGMGILLGLTTAVGSATVLFIGVRHVQTGVISLGELLLVMAYLAQLYIPLQTMSGKIADIQGSLNSAERAFALLDARPDVMDSPNARTLGQVWGSLEFRDVWFAYEPDQPVLKGISFQAPAGIRVGIAGTTGAGKSTLVSLLARFYDPSAGQVLLDGVDLREYHIADVRRQFAIVLQEPLLLSTTIAENIAYARPAATWGDIVHAAQAANAHDFITALPNGYYTEVGERGMRLSGGERQRISLARAFLRDAPILILDEPTSSVDVKTEAVIMDAMERLMCGRTTFMIAHRLSTLEMCDLRLQVELGQLTHITERDTLLGRKGA